MPITVKISEGLIDEKTAWQLTEDLIDLFLEANGVYGNEFMSKNQIADCQFVPKGRAFNGEGETSFVVISCLVPNIALTVTDQRMDFIDIATKIVLEATNGKLPAEQIFIDMTYGVMWGIGGRLYTEKDLQESIAASKQDY